MIINSFWHIWLVFVPFSDVKPELSLNPIGAWGTNIPVLLSEGYFTMKKGVWRSKISWLFLLQYKLLENKKMGFSKGFWGDPATFKSPTQLG